jgi:hypothetical protein
MCDLYTVGASKMYFTAAGQLNTQGSQLVWVGLAWEAGIILSYTVQVL